VPSAVWGAKLIRQVLPLTGDTDVAGTVPSGPVMLTSAGVNEDAWTGRSNDTSTELTAGVTTTAGVMFVMRGPPELARNPPSNATEFEPTGMRLRNERIWPLMEA
jgi:hypothetical protein